MSDLKTDKRVRFERQRRNLMISSTTMIIYAWVGLEVNTINVLGNQFSIRNTTGVETLLWLLFGYFFIRYLQFFFVVENKEFIPMYHESMEKHVQSVAIETQKNNTIPGILKKEPKAKNFCYSVRSFKIMKKYPNRWEVNLQGSIAYAYDTGAATCGTGSLEMVISGKQLYWPKIKSMCRIGVLTPHITEYFLPFILSALAVISKAINAG